MTREQKLMIDALCVAVTGQQRILDVQNVDWGKLQRLSQRHALEPLVCEGLQKAGCWEQVPQDVQQMLDSAYMKAIYRDAQLEYMKDLLQKKLEEAEVPHVFLKGAVLKYDYPVPALRTMSDMDVLVYVKDFNKIAKVAEDLEGKAEEGDGNHRNYRFPGGVLVEFHPNLLHHATPVGTQINPGWQYVKDQAETCARELTEEGIYLNTICHLANHFVAGGVGVRFVLDVWVSRHLRKTQPNRAFVEAELSRFGLLDFAENIEKLAECWFGQEPSDVILEELGEYIFSSGLYGTSDRAMLNAISFSPGGNRLSALIKKAFYPKAELEDRFPWCKGKAWLLPAAWCARAYNAVRTHGKQIRSWSEGTGNVSGAEVSAHREKLARFGITGK